MNNACPSCGAVYAVTAKDIGRKLKCKKCSSALIVDESGLVFDAPAAPPASRPAVAVAEVEDDFDNDDDEIVTRKGKKAKRGAGSSREGGPGLGALLAKIGGIPTILFSIGIFLVIWFTFMSKIADAHAKRDGARTMKLDAEAEAKAKDKLPKGKTELTMSEDERKKYMDEVKKILEEYMPQMTEAENDAKISKIDSVRSLYWDRYGTMFGFFFVSFGCICYLRTEQHIVVKYVAGAILVLMMLVVFISFLGGSESSTTLPESRPKTGMGGVGPVGPGGAKGGGFGGP